MSIFSPVSDLIENEQCRQDSLTFLHELHRFTLWATQMFDASVKFPNGVLYGSTYDMGNFDECLQVAASDGSAITGKYCLARVRITPTDVLGVHNDSAWRKIETVASDPARTRRDEVHWAFCIPSSCGPVDLRVHLEHALTTYTEQYGFSAQVQWRKKAQRNKNEDLKIT
ncbi:hypothetical protein B566_EDAN002615 [Ephemera danica]|nr:hypothetical protein B566_EDAN002615 [Ephemera danica]